MKQEVMHVPHEKPKVVFRLFKPMQGENMFNKNSFFVMFNNVVHFGSLSLEKHCRSRVSKDTVSLTPSK